MIRIIHLSDLHVRGRQTRAENENAAALVREITRMYGAGPRSKNVVVLTGDLVDDGRTTQYRHLQRNVIAPLGRRFKVLAVPGNHDYALWGNAFDRRAPARFNTYVRRIPAYPNPWIDKVEARGERRTLFIGVDSADPRDQAFFADGIVDARQRERVSTLLADRRYANHFKVLYVHHHPFLRAPFVAFRQAGEFLDVIRGKVDLVLLGHKHVHEPFLGRYDIPTMLASGKVTEPVGDGLAFRVIEIERTGSPTIYTVEVPSV